MIIYNKTKSTRLTIAQFGKILLSIDNEHEAIDCGPCLGGLNQVYRPSV